MVNKSLAQGNRPILSIVIVNYNTCKITLDCLRSVFREIKDVRFEVILVDNNSTDGSVARIRTEYPDIHVIVNRENLGFGKANNIGCKQSIGEYILLLNSDTVVLEGELGPLLYLFEQNQNLGVVGCQVLNEDYSIQDSAYHFSNFLYEYFRFAFWVIKFFPNMVYSHNRMHYWDRKSMRNVDCVSGCFMITTREIIDTYGLFDERYFMSYEDADFCYKLRRNGKIVMYYPSYRIIHYWGKSRGGNVANASSTSFESMLLYYRKNKGVFKAVMLKLLILMSWFLWFGFFAICGLFLKNDKVEKKRLLIDELIKRALGKKGRSK